MFAYRTRISGGASKQPDAAVARVAENPLSRNMMLAMQRSFLLMYYNYHYTVRSGSLPDYYDTELLYGLAHLSRKFRATP